MINWTDDNGWMNAVMSGIWKLGKATLGPLALVLAVTQGFIEAALIAMLEPIGDALDAFVLNVDIASVNVDLAKVNSMFPIPEFLIMVGAYTTLWGTVQGVKWVLKFIPTMG